MGGGERLVTLLTMKLSGSSMKRREWMGQHSRSLRLRVRGQGQALGSNLGSSVGDGSRTGCVLVSHRTWCCASRSSG